MIKTENFEKVEAESAEQLREWLERNHPQQEAVWLVTYKMAEKSKYVSREAVRDELLCFGWIDGTRREFDEIRTMQLTSSRRVEHWAKSYKDRAAKGEKLPGS